MVIEKRVVLWPYQLMANKNYHANRIVHSFYINQWSTAYTVAWINGTDSDYAMGSGNGLGLDDWSKYAHLTNICQSSWGLAYLLNQRTQQWENNRSKARITSNTMYWPLVIPSQLTTQSYTSIATKLWSLSIIHVCHLRLIAKEKCVWYKLPSTIINYHQYTSITIN